MNRPEAHHFASRLAAVEEIAFARRYLAWTRRFPRTPMAWHPSNLHGGISTDGLCPVLGRTLNHYNTRWPTVEGDARCCIIHPARSGVPLVSQLVFFSWDARWARPRRPKVTPRASPGARTMRVPWRKPEREISCSGSSSLRHGARTVRGWSKIP